MGFSASVRAAVVAPASTVLWFFDPRRQHWRDHFRIDGAEIQPLTPEAEGNIENASFLIKRSG